MAISLLEDDRFRRYVLATLVKDRSFLRSCENILEANDFKTAGNRSQNIVAKLAIDHWKRYNEPIKDMLSVELSTYARKHHLEGKAKDNLIYLGERLLRKKTVASDSIRDKLIDFKREQVKHASVQELIDLQASGNLTDEAWMEVSAKATKIISDEKYKTVDYFNELEGRISRRDNSRINRFPVLFIDPLDALVRIIARGHLGLILAPYKRGKSLMLIHIARALCLQRYNVLYFTLEDPLQDVEDRFDAGIAEIAVKKLNEMPKTLRHRFQQFLRLVRSRLKIVDATSGGLTVSDIQEIVNRERNQGFYPDAIIIDYDDELQAKKKHNERRYEFSEIYRDLRKLASENDAIVWTATQTKRGKLGDKILTGDDVAEDISKIRKVGCAISIGRGEYGEDSLYLNIAAHKFDRMNVGCSIVPDLDRMIFYDRNKTMRAFQQFSAKGDEESLTW